MLCCIHAMALCAQRIGPGKLSIGVNYNAELLGLAYFIGFEGVDIETKSVEISGRSIPKKEWHKYGFHLYEQYKKYAGSEHLAKAFAVADHLWLDYLLNLLVQVDAFPQARLTPDIEVKYYLNFSKSKDTAEARRNAATFLGGLNNFYREIDFGQYIADTKPLYAAVLNQVETHLPPSDFIRAMEDFYRKRFESYNLVPSLTIPKGMGFGLNYNQKGSTTLFNLFGAFDRQSLSPDSLDLGFGNRQRLQELSIHEFGHSFVNPVIDQVPQEKITGTERLFEPIRPDMGRQGYNTWKVCLYEHFVRAGEVVIAQLLSDTASAQRLRSEYMKDRSFIYLPVVIEELENYNKGTFTYYDAVLNVMNRLPHSR